MLKPIIIFLASLGIIDGGSDQDQNNNVKDRTEVRAEQAKGGFSATPEDTSDDDDSKHSTKEGL